MNAKYRSLLPQLADHVFLTDGGIETTLIYHDGLSLPLFAAFDLLRDEAGRAALRRYFRTHAAVAREQGLGFVLESATWRASADWGAKLGYGSRELNAANWEAIALLHEVRAEFETPAAPMVISGCIGPRGDSYQAGARMTPVEAEIYHAMQVRVFAAAGADLVTAITMTYPEEAVGIVRAARAAGMPVAISFTTETNGCLPSGHTLEAAIQQVDGATGATPEYYMVNCAHPTHFAAALRGSERWATRIRGVRPNASTRSHAELDTATELDAGDPLELATACAELRTILPNLSVFGGCCGTDHRHIRAIGEACRKRRPSAQRYATVTSEYAPSQKSSGEALARRKAETGCEERMPSASGDAPSGSDAIPCHTCDMESHHAGKAAERAPCDLMSQV